MAGVVAVAAEAPRYALSIKMSLTGSDKGARVKRQPRERRMSRNVKPERRCRA